jgi:hypothetical protein
MSEATVSAIGIREREGSEAEEMVRNYKTSSLDLDPSLELKLSEPDVATYAQLRVLAHEKEDVNEDERSKLLDVLCYLDLPLRCARILPAEVRVGEEVSLLLWSSTTCWVLKPVRVKYGYYKRIGLLKVKDRILFRVGEPVYVI